MRLKGEADPDDQGDASKPAAGSIIKEGLAEVLPNSSAQGRKDGKDDVFYNPAQVFNRDLSVLALSVFAKLRAADLEERRKRREQRATETGRPVRDFRAPSLKVLEALAATGIRSIRYIKELGERVQLIVANDLDEKATMHIRRNLEHNQVPQGRIEVTCEDANSHMYTRRARGSGGLGDDAYDVIDIDPYGTASPFLDAAVQAVADGGLLCITSTDMPILGGNNPETCFARYGGTPLKAGYVHEMALRLLLHAVTSSAAKYGREARPLLSCSIDFYLRVFVRVTDSPARAKYQASKTAVVYQCMRCESFFVQHLGEAAEECKESQRFKAARVVAPGPECPECNGRLKVGGPFHAGPLYDADFSKLCLDACAEEARKQLPGVTSWKKIAGLLTAISEEHADLVLFYKLPQLCKGLKLAPVPLKQFRGTLRDLGYRVSHFHREPEAVKTDAPNAVVYDLLRLWAEEHPPKSSPLPDLLKKELTLKRPIEWHTEEEANKTKVAKFLPNPEPNWGPKPRARSGGGEAPAAAPPSTSANAGSREAGPSSAGNPADAKSADANAKSAGGGTEGPQGIEGPTSIGGLAGSVGAGISDPTPAGTPGPAGAAEGAGGTEGPACSTAGGAGSSEGSAGTEAAAKQ